MAKQQQNSQPEGVNRGVPASVDTPAVAVTKGESHSLLTAECGHHCGVKDKKLGHCNCPECHDGKWSGLLIASV